MFDTGCLCWNGRFTNARLLGRGYCTNINVRFSNYAIIKCCGNSRLRGMFRSMRCRGQGSKARGHRAWPLGCTRLNPLPYRPYRPRPPPPSRCFLMLRECTGVQAEVDGDIVGVGGGQSAGTSGVAALVWANRISKV